MRGSRWSPLGVGLGFTALGAGTVAVLADAPALGLAAGVLGLVAGVLGPSSTGPDPALVQAEAARIDAERRITGLEAALTAAEERAEAAEQDAAEARMVPETDLAAAEADALLDPETGLYGEGFFGVTLSSRVAAARRHLRPVAIVLLEIAAGVRDGDPAVADPTMVSRHVRATLREADTACRVEGNRFALVLEDTPENGAVWTVERVRRALASERADLTLWAGVACYPAHAFDADDLLARASAALDAAKEWRQDRIEVATTSEV